MNKPISIPPNYFYACIILNILTHFLIKKFNLIVFPFNLIGIIPLVYGFYLTVRAWYLFKKNDTPETFAKSRCIVSEGCYKRSRNPMYLGGVILLIGLAILLQNIIGLVFPLLLFIVLNFMFIPFEEKKMENTFGAKYIQYKESVRRWV